MFQVKREGHKMVCEHKEVLTDSQYEKLECKELQERIDAMCKDMHIKRYIEDNSNVKISVISRYLETFDDEALHDMDMAHTAFLSAVDKMELPAIDVSREAEDTDDSDDGSVEDEDIDAEWVQRFIDNLNEIDLPCCAEIVAQLPVLGIRVGTEMRLSKKTLIRVLECFVEHNK